MYISRIGVVVQKTRLLALYNSMSVSRLHKLSAHVSPVYQQSEREAIWTNRMFNIDRFAEKMNAAIALCTFCEIHGPKVVFTTQTYHCYDDQCTEKLKFYGPKELLKQNQVSFDDGQQECDGCQSIGSVKYLSNDHEARTSFLSTHQSLTPDINLLLKHACVRSLSCEVHPGKEGVCYFGDEYRGHILSHTFTLKDAQARGFRRWCSFIILMRDKQFLLNMWPFLNNHLNEVIKELQDCADKKYMAEEAECPQRAIRLTSINGATGSQCSYVKQPRALNEITDEKHLFVRIHMWLVWILSAGARHFTEILPMSLSDGELYYSFEHSVDTEEGFTLVSSTLPSTSVNSLSEESNGLAKFSRFIGKPAAIILKNLRLAIGKEQFRKLLYCCLTGMQTLVRGPKSERLEVLFGLSSLVPRECRNMKAHAVEYVEPDESNFIGVDTSVAVPLPSPTVCRLDIVAEKDKSGVSTCSHVMKWTGTLPTKLPTLLMKIEKSLDSEKLSTDVLGTHFAALQEEWVNIAKLVHAMSARGDKGDVSGLMLSLGAGPHDRKLLDAWSTNPVSNTI